MVKAGKMREAKPIVYLVDDDPDFRELMQHKLGKLGVALETFSSPENFLAALKREKPALCLIDINFGSLKAGLQLIAAIRAVLGKELPLLVVSAASDPALVARALERGASDFVPKPVDIDILAAKLMNYIRLGAEAGDGFTFMPVPEGGADAGLEIDIAVDEVDENGVYLRSAHLFAKGAFVKLTGPFSESILGTFQTALPLTIVTCQAEGDEFVAYAEIDATDEILQRKLRHWLLDQIRPRCVPEQGAS